MIYFFASILRFCYRGIIFTAYLIFLLIPNLMLVTYYRRLDTAEGARKADQSAVRIARRLAWLFGVRTEVRGTPVDGAALVVANHISWLDIPVLHSGCAMGYVGKAEIDRWPIFRFIARTGGTIFHQRGNHDSAADVSAVMSARLQQGRKVAIFPEGGIKPGSSIRMFHARLFRSAVDVGCPVQPVMVRYMRNGGRDDDFTFREDESMLVNFCRLLSRPGVIADVFFLPPIDSVGKPRRELADAAREAVIASYES
jgi:1-acyl-sn-glycerol-3-phosphate acyltransferase